MLLDSIKAMHLHLPHHPLPAIPPPSHVHSARTKRPRSLEYLNSKAHQLIRQTLYLSVYPGSSFPELDHAVILEISTLLRRIHPTYRGN